LYYPKLSKKPRKDCSNCKACRHDIFSNHNCELHFKTSTKQILEGYPVPIPLEPCPKPLTYNQYIICSEIFKD